MSQFTVNNGEITTLPSTRRQRLFTRILIGALAFGAAIGAMLLASPDAQATPISYVNSLEAAGYTGPIAKWLSIGYYVCNADARGQAEVIIARSVYNSTGISVYMSDAYEIMGIARDELCYPGSAIQA